MSASALATCICATMSLLLTLTNETFGYFSDHSLNGPSIALHVPHPAQARQLAGFIPGTEARLSRCVVQHTSGHADLIYMHELAIAQPTTVRQHNRAPLDGSQSPNICTATGLPSETVASQVSRSSTSCSRYAEACVMCCHRSGRGLLEDLLFLRTLAMVLVGLRWWIVDAEARLRCARYAGKAGDAASQCVE